MITLRNKFCIATKPGIIFCVLNTIGVVLLGLSHSEWRIVGAMLVMFSCGVLAAQHMKIWEVSDEVETADETDKTQIPENHY